MALSEILSRTRTAGLSGKKLRVMVTFTAITGFSLFGYDQGEKEYYDQDNVHRLTYKYCCRINEWYFDWKSI